MPPINKPAINDLTLPRPAEISRCNGVTTSFALKCTDAAAGANLNATVTIDDVEYLWSGPLKDAGGGNYTADILPINGVDCKRRKREGFGLAQISFTVQNPPVGDANAEVSDAKDAELDVVEG
jgi:hypothetical protein